MGIINCILQQFLSIFLVVIMFDISEQYRILTTENDELCSPIYPRTIKLGKGIRSGLIIKQTRLNDHSIEWIKNFHCKVHIETSKHNHKEDGLFAVIQYIVFRKNETTGECIDYVQFKGHDSSTSRRFCGRANSALSMDHTFIEPLPTSQIALGNSFADNKGKMDVHIHVSKEPLKSDEEMDLSIVFTSYRSCFLVTKEDMYKPCSEIYNNVCISQQFINDGYVNCPYPDCVDEHGCGEKIESDIPQFSSVGNRVLIGSVSALFIIFIMFVCCLWGCRTHKILCWAEEFAHPSPPAPQQASSRNMEMTEQTGSRLSQSSTNQPTAPLPPEEDKPPSYDSLFSTR